MKYTKTLLLLWSAGITQAANKKDHSFIRRTQTSPRILLPWQQPQCGDPLCWCDLNDPTSTFSQCPPYPLGSIYLDQLPGLADFYNSLELDNPEYIDLQLCVPDLSSSINLGDKKVDPDILCEEGILDCTEQNESDESSYSNDNSQKECIQPCRDHYGLEVCGIKFMRDGTKIRPNSYSEDCFSDHLADSYKVRTFQDDGERKAYGGFFLLHEGGMMFLMLCMRRILLT